MNNDRQPTCKSSKWLMRNNKSSLPGLQKLQTNLVLIMIFIFPAALVPGQVQNLRSTLDTDQLSLTLNWDKPKNAMTAGDVSTYEIRFWPSNIVNAKNNYSSIMETTTSICLTRKSGLQPLTKYDFEVRVRNADRKGEWSTVSEYIGMGIL